MKALIEPSGRVAQVTEEPFEVAEPLVWVDCDDSIVADGYTYADGAFTEIKPPPPSDAAIALAAKRAAQRQALADAIGIPVADLVL